MAETLTIRPMVDADLPGVLETLRAALGETALLKRTPAQWEWKHRRNPFGESIVLVAEDVDRIAAVRAFMRWRLVTGSGAELSCVRAVDTAVHPDYQRRGLFRALNDAAIGSAREEGVDLVFNTPNDQARPGYLKQGWQMVGAIGVMLRPSHRLLARRDGDDIPSSEEILPGSALAAGLDGEDRLPVGLRTLRSAAYRDWRFAQHPTAQYVRIDHDDSTAVIRVNRRNGRDELVVSELIGPNGTAAINSAAKVSTSGYLVGWFSNGSPERRQAIRAGLIPIPRLTALTLVARKLSDVTVDPFNLQHWDLALSDLELL